ncbi:MAG: hypothetical protein SGJ04_05835 [Bacteroidota bacterium]|nr:hypothetical protein [Bacteroidota bacterium]
MTGCQLIKTYRAIYLPGEGIVRVFIKPMKPFFPVSLYDVFGNKQKKDTIIGGHTGFYKEYKGFSRDLICFGVAFRNLSDVPKSSPSSQHPYFNGLKHSGKPFVDTLEFVVE